MTYTLKLYVPDDTQPAQRQAAERLFRQALEAALGDAAMVAPVYSAYLNIVGQHGEVPDTEALTVDERLVLEAARELVLRYSNSSIAMPRWRGKIYVFSFGSTFRANDLLSTTYQSHRIFTIAWCDNGVTFFEINCPRIARIIG